MEKLFFIKAKKERKTFEQAHLFSFKQLTDVKLHFLTEDKSSFQKKKKKANIVLCLSIGCLKNTEIINTDVRSFFFFLASHTPLLNSFRYTNSPYFIDNFILL